MTMNSWKSVESWACLPPLRMLNIGTGSVVAPDAAEVAVERQVVRRPRPRARTRARRRGWRWRPSVALFGVPSSSISSASMPAWSAASSP